MAVSWISAGRISPYCRPFAPHIDVQRESTKGLLDWITARHQQGVVIAALCIGSFVLAETGLLVGRMATTNWLFARHFRRRFKKATGESPLQYLQQIRIEKAKKIMKTGPDTVEEVARVIGYENSSTFRKVFKKFNGLSSRDYRHKFARQAEQARR